MNYYTMDRQDVATKLSISTRTLDRYVAKKMFSTKKIKGKVFFHSKEITAFLQEQNTESIDIGNKIQSDRLRHIQDSFRQEENHENTENIDANYVSKSMSNTNIPSEQILATKSELELYKRLHEQNREIFVKQQEKLQEAYYRIGELEAQSKQGIPLLESQKQIKEKEKFIQLQQEKVQQLEKEQMKAEYKFQTANTLKVFYFVSTLLSLVGFSFLFALS